MYVAHSADHVRHYSLQFTKTISACLVLINIPVLSCKISGQLLPDTAGVTGNMVSDRLALDT